MSDTTLVCLLRPAASQSAIADLMKTGIPASSVSVIDGAFTEASLTSLDIAKRDLEYLREGVANGGVAVVVEADAKHEEAVERIFECHRAEARDTGVADEGIAVGNHAGNRDGVQAYRRVIGIPTEQDVVLRESRRPVDGTVAEGDAVFSEGTIDLTETAEELVIVKNAQVVEEVRIGKAMAERTERIHETVRRTEIDVRAFPGERSDSQESRT